MPARIVLSEVLASLSYALDLTDGQPAGHTMRSCLIGMRMGRELGLGTEDRSALYYALLLKDTGCSGNASQLAELFGTDDRALKPHMRFVDLQSRFKTVLGTASIVGQGQSLAVKLGRLFGIASDETMVNRILRIRCDRGAQIALQLGFPPETAACIRHIDEAWSGRGSPDGLAGQDIPLLSRIASLAQTLDMFHHRDGLKPALKMAQRRSGMLFDPVLVKMVLGWRHDDAWWKRLESTELSVEVVAEEPVSLTRWVNEQELDAVAQAFANIIDAKSPYTFSHSSNVASYSLALAQTMGLDAMTQRRIYRAGLLHDIGKLGVSNRILDKNGPLTVEEREIIERHPLHTWEILSRVPAFRDFAWPAALHHERLDGFGYPWRLSGSRLDTTARILAVADVYEAITADRPYRKGMNWEKARDILWDGRKTKFDAGVLDALDACVSSQKTMHGLAPSAAAA